MALKLSNTATSTEADALAALFNSGKLRLYDGARPANPNTAVSTQVLLSELTFGNPAFGAAANGVLTANAITADSDADATGTATWFRCVKSDGTTVICDGDVATSASDFNMNSVAIQIHAQINASAFVVTVAP